MAYFVRDKSTIYFVYNGNLINLSYQQIHHYGGCEYAQFNIVSADNIVDFFGMKEGGWYHVQIVGEHSSLWKHLKVYY